MEVKICPKCEQVLPLGKFAWKNKSKGKLNSYCKVCAREYAKKHYRKNKSYYKEKGQRSKDKARKAAIAFLAEYLRVHPCVDCGENDIRVLEFDHVRGGKPQNYATRMIWNSLDMIKEELVNCEVRCCNCHRRRHVIENKGAWRNWYTRWP